MHAPETKGVNKLSKQIEGQSFLTVLKYVLPFIPNDIAAREASTHLPSADIQSAGFAEASRPE